MGSRNVLPFVHSLLWKMGNFGIIVIIRVDHTSTPMYTSFEAFPFCTFTVLPQLPLGLWWTAQKRTLLSPWESKLLSSSSCLLLEPWDIPPGCHGPRLPRCHPHCSSAPCEHTSPALCSVRASVLPVGRSECHHSNGDDLQVALLWPTRSVSFL